MAKFGLRADYDIVSSERSWSIGYESDGTLATTIGDVQTARTKEVCCGKYPKIVSTVAG